MLSNDKNLFALAVTQWSNPAYNPLRIAAGEAVAEAVAANVDIDATVAAVRYELEIRLRRDARKHVMELVGDLYAPTVLKTILADDIPALLRMYDTAAMAAVERHALAMARAARGDVIKGREAEAKAVRRPRSEWTEELDNG